MYEKINLNLFNANVASFFDEVITRPDNSLTLIKWESLAAPQVDFYPGETSYNKKSKRYYITVHKENRKIKAVINVFRTSVNCYIVVGSSERGTFYKRLPSLEAAAQAIAGEYCENILIK